MPHATVLATSAQLQAEETCDKFVQEFKEDAVRVFGMRFGPNVEIGQGLQYDPDRRVVRLYANITHEKETWVVMQPQIFYDPQWKQEAAVGEVSELLEITEDEARTRLTKAGLYTPADPHVNRLGEIGKMEISCARCTQEGSKEGCSGACPDCSKYPAHEAHAEDCHLEEGYQAMMAAIEEDGLVLCKGCQEQVPAEKAHLHQGGYIGDCCWDERLKTTE